MINKDLKYIIKRVIIGFCIVFLFSFVKRCNVKAYYYCAQGERCLTGLLESNNGYSYYDNDSSYQLLYNVTNGNSSFDIKIYYKENRLYFASSVGSEIINLGDNNLNKDTIFITYQSNNYYLNITDNNHIIGPNVFINSNVGNCTGLKIGNFERYINQIKINYNANMNNKIYLTDYSNTSWVQVSPTYQTNTSWVKFSAFDILSVNDSDILYNGTELINPLPQFISLNPQRILSDKKIVLGYSFKPEFDIFNTSIYDYQYKFSDSYWLNLSENSQEIKIRGNGVVYFRIKDKTTNDIINSQTFTITDIGNIGTENVNYDINFLGEYRTVNYNNNNISDNSSSIIETYQISIDYIPKNSILKYQYQYVEDGSSLDNNNWQNVASSDNGSVGYTADENGVLYARILDKNDNVMYTSTFTVSSIGKLALDNNEKKVQDFYTMLRNKVNFGGPIGSLINIPVVFFQTISDSFNGATGVCRDYELGNLMGTDLKLSCIDIREYLGSSLYTTIDIIFSSVIFYFICKMITNAYYNFISMEKSPIPNPSDETYIRME